MEYDSKNGKISTNKILNELDKFTLDFVKILEEFTPYVIVSGYVSILLGRTRASEDVDLLIPEMSIENFNKMFLELDSKGFECANTSIPKEAFEMLNHHAIRFYRSGIPVPNMEFKKITTDIQREAFSGRLKVELSKPNCILYISPLELQIAYKLSIIAQGKFEEISSDKDFEDAKHLYAYFGDKLDMEKLIYYVNLFKVMELWE